MVIVALYPKRRIYPLVGGLVIKTSKMLDMAVSALYSTVSQGRPTASEPLPVYDALFTQISQLVESARGQVQRNINTLMVQTYWHIGRVIVKHEQQGASRATYGKAQLHTLAQQLTERFGKGFDATNLRNMRRFFQAFPIRETLYLELSWSHYNLLARVENTSARSWYMQEAISQSWSVRALERQISVLYYERLLASQDRALVAAEAEAKTAPLADSPRDFLRDPYILDFLNLEGSVYQEADVERGIISNLQHFLLELGKGFAFVERQQRRSIRFSPTARNCLPPNICRICRQKKNSSTSWSANGRW